LKDCIPELPVIDWRPVWLAPYRGVGQRVHARWAACGSLAEALNAERPLRDPGWPAGPHAPLRFVPQADLPAGQGYEAFIFACAEVPTRDNLHDFFNGLVWLTWPVLKHWLNRQQAAQLAGAVSLPGRRGPVRDALTLFDENAAVWRAPAPLFEALRRRDWPAVFRTQRVLWADSTLTLVGHALMEKLCQPRKGITAHVWWMPLEPVPTAPPAWEAALCAQLTPDCLVQRPWAPLPVLGVPGWWPANEAPSFYDDPEVFRPRG
jgi:hypothetical protein